MSKYVNVQTRKSQCPNAQMHNGPNIKTFAQTNTQLVKQLHNVQMHNYIHNWSNNCTNKRSNAQNALYNTALPAKCSNQIRDPTWSNAQLRTSQTTAAQLLNWHTQQQKQNKKCTKKMHKTLNWHTPPPKTVFCFANRPCSLPIVGLHDQTEQRRRRRLCGARVRRQEREVLPRRPGRVQNSRGQNVDFVQGRYRYIQYRLGAVVKPNKKKSEKRK